MKMTEEAMKLQEGLSIGLKEMGIQKDTSIAIALMLRTENQLLTAGLDSETHRRESLGGQSAQDSSENLGRGQIKTGYDGINGPRYVDETFTTPQGEIYGFVVRNCPLQELVW